MKALAESGARLRLVTTHRRALHQVHERIAPHTFGKEFSGKDPMQRPAAFCSRGVADTTRTPFHQSEFFCFARQLNRLADMALSLWGEPLAR